MKMTNIFLLERRDCFDVLRRIWAGIENALVALAKARQRIEH
jgi:hypothetical protein